MNTTGGDADYRKFNDRSLNSSTYHKKDGTPVRAKLQSEFDMELNLALECEEKKMTVQEVVDLAKRHLGEGEMASSAKLCYDDAVRLLAKGKEEFAYQRALRSLSYSVGVFHADYKRAEH